MKSFWFVVAGALSFQVTGCAGDVRCFDDGETAVCFEGEVQSMDNVECEQDESTIWCRERDGVEGVSVDREAITGNVLPARYEPVCADPEGRCAGGGGMGTSFCLQCLKCLGGDDADWGGGDFGCNVACLGCALDLLT